MSEYKNIGSFSKVRRGASPRPIGDPSFFGGNVGWVRISDVTQRNNKFLRNTQQYLSPLGESKSLRVDSGDLIMSICATVGKPMIVDMPACIHDGFVQIYDLKNADTEYLYYLLQFHEKDFEKRGQPGTQVNLNTIIVENEIVFMPGDIKKQQKIAKILTTIDQLIEKTQVLIDKHTAIKQGMMADLFTRGIDLTTGQLRPLVEQAPHLYKETELGWMPKDWKIDRLGNYTDICRGASPRPISDPIYFGESEVGWVRISDVTKSKYYLKNTTQYLSPIGEAKSVRVYPGDLIMSICATVGKPVILAMDACIHDGFVLFSNYQDTFTKEFLLYWLAENEKTFINMGQPGTQVNLNTSLVGSLKTIIPSLDEQKNIVEIIGVTNKKINNEEKLLKKLTLKKKGLMQDLLTGKVSVKEN